MKLERIFLVSQILLRFIQGIAAMNVQQPIIKLRSYRFLTQFISPSILIYLPNSNTSSMNTFSLIRRDNFHHFIFFSIMQTKRAQTADPNKHKNKHQLTLLKEIKTLQLLQKTQQQEKTQTKLTRKIRNSSQQSYHNPLQLQLQHIDQLRGQPPKHKFSIINDEKEICKRGWTSFAEKVERQTHNNLNNIRKKAKALRTRATVSSICIQNKTNNFKDTQETFLNDQKIKNIWNVVRGPQDDHETFFRVSDLNKDVKNSLVLSNAYRLCLHSKSYKLCSEQQFTDQKFKSFIYLNQNMHKLTKKSIHSLLRNNWLML